jgi:D-amino-acid dehydrogenase
MTTRRSPFIWQPRPDVAFLSWCWRFWRSSSEARWRRGTAQLLTLNAHTFQLFDELRDYGASFEMHATGLVFASRTHRGLTAFRALFRAVTELGYPGAIDEWGPAEARENEAALSDAVVGAFFAGEERHVRPESFVKGLLHAVKAAGVEVVERVDVQRVARTRGRWSLQTQMSSHVSDAVVVAAGVSSRALLRPLGIRLPLESAKGYSITATGEGTIPRHALYFGEAKVGCSPFADTVRLGGTFALGAQDLSLRRRRLDAITASAALYLRDWRPAAAVEWAGLRPVSPDGLPLIGSLPGQESLFVATGHGMLGVTLAPATAALLTPLVLDGRRSPEIEPFRPDRFKRVVRPHDRARLNRAEANGRSASAHRD